MSRKLVRVALVVVPLGAVGLGSLAFCTRHHVVDFAMTSAYRPSPARGTPRPYVLLAGDVHCHVSPPDHPQEAVRDLRETEELAKREKLDFVILTPHVGARFFQSARVREAVRERLAGLEAALPRGGRTRFLVGFEYTDHYYGHVGAAFADLGRVLDRVDVRAATAAPGRFFEEWVAQGGLLFLNHPLVTPLDSVFAMARADVSWRPWTGRGPVPPEIAAADRLFHGAEAYNLSVTHLRDRYLQRDTLKTLRATLRRLDDEIRARGRRLTPVAGSDSHSSHLRPVLFALARGRTREAIREAILAGRVCLRDGRACTLEARVPGGDWTGVGGAIEGAREIELRARGAEVRFLQDGEVAAAGPRARLSVDPARCTILRAEVDHGFSAPIYVNCAFAGR